MITMDLILSTRPRQLWKNGFSLAEVVRLIQTLYLCVVLFIAVYYYVTFVILNSLDHQIASQNILISSFGISS